MAKQSRKSKAGVKKPSAQKRAATSKSRTMGLDFEDHICACDLTFREDEATPDSQLPPAIGGVEGDKFGRRAR